MRLSLKWKVVGAYTALIGVVMFLLAAHLGDVGNEYLTRELRIDLLKQCRLAGEMVAAAGEQQLAGPVARIANMTGARVTVVAASGRVLADSEGDVGHMDPHDTRIEVVEARQEGTGWSIRHSATVGTDMMYVASCSGPKAPVVRLALPMTAVHEASAALQRAILWAALVAAILAAVAGGWLTQGMARSLDELLRVARSLGTGDLTARARLESKDETAELALALNTMADNLQTTRQGLERSAAHLRSVLGQMADGVAVVSLDERVQILNRAAGELLGIAPERAVGRRLSEVALNYDLVEFCHRALRLRTLVRDQIVSHGEPERTLALSANPILDDSGEPIGTVVSLRDITELMRLQKVRQDFVANASHELRTPVASIRALAETLEGGALEDPQASRRFVSQIVENTGSLGRLLDDMMTLARLDSLEGQPRPRPLEVLSSLQKAVSRLAPQAATKELQVTVTAPEGLAVWCSEDDFLSALVNLIDNAVKYTPPQGSIEVSGQATDKGEVRITVTDTGPGIPEEARARVFERFYRVDRSRSRALGGTGLGLSIVKHAVESSGGRVWVEAPEEGGSRFVIVLPQPPEKT